MFENNFLRKYKMKTQVPECDISDGDTAKSRMIKNFNDACEKNENYVLNETYCMAAGSQEAGIGSEIARNLFNIDDTSQNQSLVFGRTEFNKNRTIIIRNVPAVTYDEVKSFMGQFTVANIAISKRLRHALVTLKHGEEAESCIASLNKMLLKDKLVEVSLYRNDNLLCITNLPLTMEDVDFRKFVEPFGQVEKGFLMRSNCGKSLGYGFVEFMHNREKSERARQQIDLKFINSNVVRCHFVKDTILSYSQLNSRCLIADGLPNTFSDRTAAYNFFGVFEGPCSCETGTVQDRFLGFTVAEFNTVEAAQRTFELLHDVGHVCSSVQVSFASPGETIAEVFSSMVAVKSHLLLPNSLLSNLFSSLGGDRTSGAPSSSMPPTDPASIVNPLVWPLLQQNPIVLENFVQLMRLLGQQQQQHQLLGQQRQQHSVDPSANFGFGGMIPNAALSLGNPNLQISLLSVMLAAQLQQLQPALLTNPALLLQLNPGVQLTNANPLIAQANTLLQSLMINQAPAATRIIQTTDPSWNTMLCQGGLEPGSVPISALHGVYPAPQSQQPPAPALAADTSQERPLFFLAKDLHSVPSSKVDDQAERQPRPILGMHPGSETGPYPIPAMPDGPASPIVAQAIEVTIRDRLHNLEKHRTKDHAYQNASCAETLNTEKCKGGIGSLNTPKSYGRKHERQRQNAFHSRCKQVLRQRFLDNAAQPEEQTSELPAALFNQPKVLTANRASSQPALFDCDINQTPAVLIPSQSVRLRSTIKPTAIHGPSSCFEPNQLGRSTLTESWQRKVPSFPVSQPNASLVKNEVEEGTQTATHLRAVGSTMLPVGGKGNQGSELFQATPGQKRPHFLQSPEPSPEGPYVGQHSQGIGGHYAESYFKQKKL